MNKSIERSKKKTLIIKNIIGTTALGLIAATLAYSLFGASLFGWNWPRYIEQFKNQSIRILVLEIGLLFFNIYLVSVPFTE